MNISRCRCAHGTPPQAPRACTCQRRNHSTHILRRFRSLSDVFQVSAWAQAELAQRNAQLEALVAEQQLLQHEGGASAAESPAAAAAAADVAAADAGTLVAVAAGPHATDEACANGCSDASWQDATMQASASFHFDTFCCPSH